MPVNRNRYQHHINTWNIRRSLKQKPLIFNFESSTTTVESKRRYRSKTRYHLDSFLPIENEFNINEPKINLNISGARLEIYEKLLDRYPDTLLGSKSLRSQHYDKYKNEYFYDRSPSAFEGILFFYQSKGRFVLPSFVHAEIFYEEIKYFKLVDYLTLDSKCDESILYVAYLDLLNEIDKENSIDKNSKKLNLRKRFHRIKAFSEYNDDIDDESEIPKNKYLKSLFYLIEKPNKSVIGKTIMFFFLSAVIVSIIVMCMETIIISENKTSYSSINDIKSTINYTKPEDERVHALFVLEIICNVIFTIEICLRFLATNKKLRFIRRFSNVVDLIAIFPFWLTLILKYFFSIDFGETADSARFEKQHSLRFGNLYILKILRLTRVLRILKLSRHVRALNIMGRILYECVYEISLLLTFLGMNIVIFSSLIYYIELHSLGNASPFISIPHAFWWAIISFTTVGYGDLIPTSSYGKFFGSIFILCGILIALLPTPILSCKFERIYKKLSLFNRKSKLKQKTQNQQEH